MRVLGRIRLSRLTDESTSAARQKDIIESWAKSNDHEIVGWAEDLDVSGSVDPFDTQALGPWLTQERRGDWDVLCAWKLDRIGRRAIPLNKMFGWIMDNQKVLVCVSDNIDLSTWVGRLVANVIAGVAEGELEAIRERTKASRRKLLESGRWPGGAIPYGLKGKQLKGGGWVLVLDPDTAPVVRMIVQQVSENNSVLSVAESLNSRNIPAPKGGKWKTRTIWQLVTAKYLLGHATYDRQTIRDREGKPVLNAEPILTQQEWDDLQHAVATRRNTPMRTRSTSPLLGVALCYDCKTPLHHRVHTKPSGQYRYYYCHRCKPSATLLAETVEGLLEEVFLETVGAENMLEKVFIPAEDHQAELEEAQRAVTEISALLGTMTSTTVRTRLTEQLGALDARVQQLEQLPSRQAGFDYKGTGLTFKSAWDNSDTEDRRQLLLRSGITYSVKRIPDTQVVLSDLYIPEEILDRLNAKKSPSQ